MSARLSWNQQKARGHRGREKIGGRSLSLWERAARQPAGWRAGVRVARSVSPIGRNLKRSLIKSWHPDPTLSQRERVSYPFANSFIASIHARYSHLFRRWP